MKHKPKKIYLAGMFSKKNQLRERAKDLRRLKHVVTSEWLREHHALKSKEKEFTLAVLQFFGARDRRNIRSCKVFILFTPTNADLKKVGRGVDEMRRLARAGHEWECGFAHALEKRIIICGQRMNAFHYSPRYEVYATWDEVLKNL